MLFLLFFQKKLVPFSGFYCSIARNGKGGEGGGWERESSFNDIEKKNNKRRSFSKILKSTFLFLEPSKKRAWTFFQQKESSSSSLLLFLFGGVCGEARKKFHSSSSFLFLSSLAVPSFPFVSKTTSEWDRWRRRRRHLAEEKDTKQRQAKRKNGTYHVTS